MTSNTICYCPKAVLEWNHVKQIPQCVICKGRIIVTDLTEFKYQ